MRSKSSTKSSGEIPQVQMVFEIHLKYEKHLRNTSSAKNIWNILQVWKVLEKYFKRGKYLRNISSTKNIWERLDVRKVVDTWIMSGTVYAILEVFSWYFGKLWWNIVDHRGHDFFSLKRAPADGRVHCCYTCSNYTRESWPVWFIKLGAWMIETVACSYAPEHLYMRYDLTKVVPRVRDWYSIDSHCHTTILNGAFANRLN